MAHRYPKKMRMITKPLKAAVHFFAIIIPLIISVFFLVGCSADEPDPPVLDLTKLEQDEREADTGQRTLRVAVAAITGPRDTYRHYSSLVEYLSGRLEIPVRFVQRQTYSEVNELLARNELDMAFVCSGGYVMAARQGTVDLLVIPVIDSKTTYRSYLIVPASSTDTSLADLRGKTFAFTDPLSQTGHNYPYWLLRRAGENPNGFFSNTFYTHGHDNSIQAVARGTADGACVDGLVYDYLQEHRPHEVQRVKVVHRSQEFGIPPVVTPVGLDSALRVDMRAILLSMSEDSTGISILNRLGIDEFALGADSSYNSIRAMLWGDQ